MPSMLKKMFKSTSPGETANAPDPVVKKVDEVRLSASGKRSTAERLSRMFRRSGGRSNKFQESTSLSKSLSKSLSLPSSDAFTERTQSTLSMSLSSKTCTESIYKLRGSEVIKDLNLFDCIEDKKEERNASGNSSFGGPVKAGTVSSCIEEATSSQLLEESSDASFTTKDSGTPTYVWERHERKEFGYMRFRFTEITDACDVAREEHKPIFVILTDFPGDQEFGRTVLSHPLILECLQSLFVTVWGKKETSVQVHRSASGKKCRATLSFLGPNSLEELVPSLEGDDLNFHKVVNAMAESLRVMDQEVPRYFSLFEAEQTSASPRQILVGTNKGSSAETIFADKDGVVATRAGTFNHQPVVSITFDPRRTTLGRVVRLALEELCCEIVFYRCHEERVATQVEVSRVRTANPVLLPWNGSLDEDESSVSLSKHYIRGTPLRFVPLSDLQACRANQLIMNGRFNEAMHLLSPWQGQILMKAMRSCTTLFEVVDVPIPTAWSSVCEEQHPSALRRSSSDSHLEYVECSSANHFHNRDD